MAQAPESADVLVLACTHYPLIAPMLRRVVPSHMQIVDSAESTARVVRKMIGEDPTLSLKAGEKDGAPEDLSMRHPDGVAEANEVEGLLSLKDLYSPAIARSTSTSPIPSTSSNAWLTVSLDARWTTWNTWIWKKILWPATGTTSRGNRIEYRNPIHRRVLSSSQPLLRRKSDVTKNGLQIRCCSAVGHRRLAVAQAQMPNPYGESINLEDAKKVAAPALAEAARLHLNMAVAIVDISGNLVYYEKMDNTQLATSTIAIDKARSAARLKRTTKSMQDVVAGGGEGLRILKLDEAVPLEGGIPLVRDGKIIGAIGASGSAGKTDSQVAQAGADSIK